MGKILLALVGIVLMACGTKHDNPDKKGLVEVKLPLEYYKCDYLKGYDTLLMSGESNQIPAEIWGVNRGNFSGLSQRSLDEISIDKIIAVAQKHLAKRFPDITPKFSGITLEKISENDGRNWCNVFFDVSFVYNEKGYIQKVPVLPDGRIILSNVE